MSYQLRTLLGSGGQATVYRARSPTTGLFRAIKIVPLDSTSSEGKEKGKKVMRELRIHETLEHANVLRMWGGEYREREGGWEEGLYLLLDLGE